MGWSDYNPLNVITGANASAKKGIRSIYDRLSKRPGEEEEAERKRLLYEQAASAGQFAGQGEAGYGAMTGELAADRERLRRLASGEDSLSAEGLRQGLQQQYAAQRSMAASASPSNAPMAARTAMMGMNRAASGMAGNAAMAGIAERNAATQALAGMNLGQRGQDVQVGLGSRQNAISGYSNGKTDPEASILEKLGAGAAAAIPLITGRGKSDQRLKTDISSGNDAANRTLDALRAQTYRYKDEKHGKGKQLGILAQDLEKAGLRQAVVNERDGKAIDGAKLAGANTALLAAVAKRLAKLEGRAK